MLWRFSLYGFLKNQQYYEPFFLLVLQAKHLSFFQIGLLFSFREIWVNVMGIPAGFLSDIYGRRASLLICFGAYLLAFLGFALTQSLPLLFASMFAFAVGESFRSGTHKAMIFQHLRDGGRESEKAVVYGFTRSWSKIGSAVSAVASGVLMVFTSVPAHIFLYTIPPYVLGMLNIATYPAALEGESKERPKEIKTVLATMARETWACVRQPDLRRLFIESAALQGAAKTVKDYVQPLMVVALAAPLFAGAPQRLNDLSPVKKGALVLAGIYAVLSLAAAWGSRQSHHFQKLARARVPWLWLTLVSVGALLLLGLLGRGHWPFMTGVAVMGFILLVLLENLWRPLFLDRLDDVSDSKFGAAVLSVEAQFGSLVVMALAPAVGLTVDRFGLAAAGWWVVGLGLALSAFVFLTPFRNEKGTPPASP